jgi:uncharacterized protein
MIANARPHPRSGLYEDTYWEYAGRSELRLQRCECGRFRYPPGPTCPDCLSDEFAWEPLSGRATLLAWTTFHRQYFPELPPPYIVAVVATVEGPLLVGNLVDVPDPSDIAHGMALTAVAEHTRFSGSNGRIFQWTPAAARDSHDSKEK